MELKTEATPRYQHDCPICVFKGSFEKWDVYVCSKGLLGDSLIARFGDSGEQYASFPRKVFVDTVKNGLDGNILNDATQRFWPPAIPGWMLAILVCEYRFEDKLEKA